MASSLKDKDKSQPENKTFYHDDLLPSMPLPSVHQTIEKYLDSCRAILSKEEYRRTKYLCDEFKKNDALGLQVNLMQKAINQRNWLETWWLDKAYLEVRQPILFSNFGGPGPYFEDEVWSLKENTQLERVSVAVHILMQFWQEVREETYPQHKAADGSSLSMHQLRYMFNTCRIPKPKKDELHHSFKTVAEGTSPTHLIVFHKKRIYKIQGVNPTTGKIYTPPEFYKLFSDIKYDVTSSEREPLAALTCLDRDTWSDARAHMIELSSTNEKNLYEIESAIVCICLDDSNPMGYTEILNVALCGGSGNRWNDKSFNYTCTENGALMATNDHTPYEAMVLISFVEFTFAAIRKIKGKWHSWTAGEVEPVEELVFDIDAKLKGYISQGQREYAKFGNNLDVKMTQFTDFGKNSLKSSKVHSDAFIQICLQLAYMRLHEKPAPTYETATTRGFYRGRTETCRTCTPECVDFCKAMIAGSLDAFTLFIKAHDKFLWLMKECKQNRGCDRHLFALALQRMENGESPLDLFSDIAFTKTGGAGNCVLSTSLTGYSYGTGGVAPMVEDGYGFFYRILGTQFLFTVTAFKSSSVTDSQLFTLAICKAFADVHELIKRSSHSKL